MFFLSPNFLVHFLVYKWGKMAVFTMKSGFFDAKKIVFREGYVINLSVFPLKKEIFGVKKVVKVGKGETNFCVNRYIVS